MRIYGLLIVSSFYTLKIPFFLLCFNYGRYFLVQCATNTTLKSLAWTSIGNGFLLLNFLSQFFVLYFCRCKMLSKSRMVGEMEMVWPGILVKEPSWQKRRACVCLWKIENAL